MRLSSLALVLALLVPACRDLDVPTWCTNNPGVCEASSDATVDGTFDDTFDAAADTTDAMIDSAADTTIATDATTDAAMDTTDAKAADTMDAATDVTDAIDAFDAADAATDGAETSVPVGDPCPASATNLLANPSFEDCVTSVPPTCDPWKSTVSIGLVGTNVVDGSSAVRVNIGGYAAINQTVTLPTPLPPGGHIYARVSVRLDSGPPDSPELVLFPIVGTDTQGPIAYTIPGWAADGNWHQLHVSLVNNTGKTLTGLTFEVTSSASGDAAAGDQFVVVDDADLRVCGP